MSTNKSYQEKMEIPEKVEVEIVDSILKIKGEKGTLERDFLSPQIKIKKEDKSLVLSADKFSRKEKRILNTFKAHINNMFKGVLELYIYKLKICSSHFPMTVSVEGDQIMVANFLGEKVPRKTKILQDTTVEIQGDTITVSSASKEFAGQTAANIEQITKIKKRDRRVFQDGCFIFEKAGKSVI